MSSVEVGQQLLARSIATGGVDRLVAPDAVNVSLTYDNRELTQLMPHAVRLKDLAY